jgi:predicted CXXCH cytochrome family protein
MEQTIFILMFILPFNPIFQHSIIPIFHLQSKAKPSPIIYLSLCMIFSLCTFNISFAGVTPPKNPNSAKGCAICHYRWIDTFFVDGKGSDLVEYQSEKVVATPEMCFSCHDGSVKDSRTKRDKNYGHKTNMTPPAHMKIPEIFPLDETAKVQCATCHTAHGVPSGGDTHETIFMRVSNKNSAMCVMCHADKDGGQNAGNHPMGNVQQEVPRKLISLGAVTGQGKNQVICETCHTAHGSQFETLLVDGAGNSGLCLDCHKDKNIFTPQGKRKPFHVINVATGKVKIPQALLNKGAKLGYNGIITCQTCHKVHNNKIEKQLLLIKKDDASTFCLTCHKDKKYLKETKHNIARTAPHEKNLEGKTATESGICSACHLPHKAARKLSGEGDFTTQLCLSCHTQGNVAEKVLITGTSHPLNVNPYEEIDSLDVGKNRIRLPLFNTSGAPSINGKITCATCHDPHGSGERLAKAKSKNGVKAGRTLLLRNRMQYICEECHQDKNLIAGSKHDLSKVAPETKNILGMKPS